MATSPSSFWTAHGKPNSVKDARAAGLSEILTNPRTAKDRLARIQAILYNPGPSSMYRPIFDLAGGASRISPMVVQSGATKPQCRPHSTSSPKAARRPRALSD
jgi:hypothetical protein